MLLRAAKGLDAFPHSVRVVVISLHRSMHINMSISVSPAPSSSSLSPSCGTPEGPASSMGSSSASATGNHGARMRCTVDALVVEARRRDTSVGARAPSRLDGGAAR